MEGLIPFVYKAIVEYKNANRDHHGGAAGLLGGCWLNGDSPSASYTRLPGDSDARFAFSSAQDQPSSQMSMAGMSGVHSPVRRRSVAA